MWYAPVVAISATLDYFILASPAQSLFVTTVALHPARRIYAALCFGAGAALGALLLAAGIQFLDIPVETLLANQDASSVYFRLQTWLDAWGLWALIGLSLIPVPLRSAVILAALAGLSFYAIGFAVLLGRLVVLLAIGQIVYRTPDMLMRIPFVRRFVERFEAKHSFAQSAS